MPLIFNSYSKKQFGVSRDQNLTIIKDTIYMSVFEKHPTIYLLHSRLDENGEFLF